MLTKSKPLPPARFAIVAVVITLVLIVAASLLPHSRYIRFNSSHEPVLHKVKWIYQRLHFDPTPIDVVFIGSSHTVYGIDAEQVEEVATKVSGEHIHIANFALIHPGRDMDYLVTREVLKTKRPHLLVIEVQEAEPRATHVAFYRFADVSDVVLAPMIINTHYFSNLMKLPRRQASLFLRTLTAPLFDSSTKLGPPPYWHDTFEELGGQIPLTTILTQPELEDELKHSNALAASKIYLPTPLRPLEYRVSLIYLKRIILLAHEKKVPIRFVYLPSWHGDRGPPAPVFAPLYLRYGPIWDPASIFKRTEVWADVNHLNCNGRRAVSAWLGQKIGEEWPKSGDERQVAAREVVQLDTDMRHGSCSGEKSESRSTRSPSFIQSRPESLGQ
jgi:hypothetical protein